MASASIGILHQISDRSPLSASPYYTNKTLDMTPKSELQLTDEIQRIALGPNLRTFHKSIQILIFFVSAK